MGSGLIDSDSAMVNKSSSPMASDLELNKAKSPEAGIEK